MTSRNIPFIKYGGRKFIEAAHVKDVLAFLRILLNPMDELAWFRTLGNLDGVGEVTAKRVAQQIVTNGSGINGLTEISYPSKKATNSAKRLCEGLSRINPWTTDPEEAVRLTLEYYIPVFREKFSDDFNRRMKDLEAVQRLAERCLDVESFLVDMALEPPESSLDSVGPSDKEKELLVLSTIHSAKGLEWHSVFLISLNDGCLPVTYSLGSDADLDEERRLFYVAATRAKRNLFLIHHLHKRTPKHQFGMEALNFEKPSRFILEISNFDDLTEKASWAPEPSLPPYPDNRQETHASGEGNSNATVDRIRKHFEGQ